MLCLPAFYNRYPLLFSDLLDYAGDGMKVARRVWPHWAGNPFRGSSVFAPADMWPSGNHPPFYGMAIWPLHFEVSLWPVIVVQGLVVSHVIAVLARALELRLSERAFLVVIAGLTLLTSLPWYVSHVMPDVFGGVAVLSLFLVMFRADALSRWELVYFCGLSAASLLMHVSFFPVAAGEVAIGGAWWLLQRRNRPAVRPLLAAVPVLAALCLSTYTSVRLWGGFSGPKFAPPYLLAHTLVDGAGKQYLRAVCGHESYVLCADRDDLPDDVEDFMFRSFSPLYDPGNYSKVRAEAMPIVIGAAKMFPLETLKAAVRSGVAQVLTFNTEVAPLESISDGKGGSLGDVFAMSYPFIGRGYQGTRQQLGELGVTGLSGVNALDRGIVYASAAVCAFLLVQGLALGDAVLVQLLMVTIAGLVINGMVSGAAVGVFGRFEARIIWLLPLAAAVGLVRLRQRSARRGTDRAPSGLVNPRA